MANRNVLEIVEKQNISSSGFIIQKAEIEFTNQYGSQKFLANIKFEYPGKYLISLKSRTGIEGVRIFINDDSLFVNDRINKMLYFGTPLYLKRKLGISTNLLPLIFGDLVLKNGQKNTKENCVNDILLFNCIVDGVSLNYQIDCKKGKTASVKLRNSYLSESVSVKSHGYMKAGTSLMPKYLDIEDLNSNIKIRIRYIKFDQPWSGTVKFVPGKGYELKELL